MAFLFEKETECKGAHSQYRLRCFVVRILFVRIAGFLFSSLYKENSLTWLQIFLSIDRKRQR